MAKYEFKFVVTDVELSEKVQERVAQAVGQAGALAVAEVTPAEAITLRYGFNKWWRGIPPVEFREPLEAWAAEHAGESRGNVQ
jgi:hypothetical protein